MIKKFSWDKTPNMAGRKRTVVFTNGVFDLLHVGHVGLLELAALHGDYLVVGINSDASVKRLKGVDRPIHSLQHRMRMVAALGCVDEVHSFDEDTPLELIRRVRPQVLVKGGEYATDAIVGAEDVFLTGGRVVSIPMVPEVSTTSIIKRIRSLPFPL